MITEQSIKFLIIALAEARGWEPSTASRKATGSGDTLDRIDGGIGLTLRRANDIIRRCSSLWPADVAWPSKIVPRPKSSTVAS